MFTVNTHEAFIYVAALENAAMEFGDVVRDLFYMSLVSKLPVAIGHRYCMCHPQIVIQVYQVYFL